MPWFEIISVFYYRLEEPIQHSLWGWWRGFRLYLPKPEQIWMKPEIYKWGVTVCTHTEIQGKSPEGLHLRIPKRVLFFAYHQYNADFRPLTLRPFWQLSAFDIIDVNRWKFPNFCAGVLQVPKTAKMGTFEGVFVISIKLKRHNFVQQESFRGLVDIPRIRICLLWVSFGGGIRFGRYKPTKTTNFGDRRTTLLRGSTSLARGQHTLFEPILQCTCNRCRLLHVT